MSLKIGVTGSFSESEYSLQETILKLTKERDRALSQAARLESEVLELRQSKEDAVTALFRKGIAGLREEFLNVIEDQRKEIKELKQFVAPLLVERGIRLEKEAAEKEAEEKEAALSFVPNEYGQRAKEKLRQGTLAQIEAFSEKHKEELRTNRRGAFLFIAEFWIRFNRGEIPFPMEDQV